MKAGFTLVATVVNAADKLAAAVVDVTLISVAAAVNVAFVSVTDVVSTPMVSVSSVVQSPFLLVTAVESRAVVLVASVVNTVFVVSDFAGLSVVPTLVATVGGVTLSSDGVLDGVAVVRGVDVPESSRLQSDRAR